MDRDKPGLDRRSFLELVPVLVAIPLVGDRVKVIKYTPDPDRHVYKGDDGSEVSRLEMLQTVRRGEIDVWTLMEKLKVPV